MDHIGPGNVPEVEVNEKTVKVTYTYLMPTTPTSECKLSYRSVRRWKSKNNAYL